MAADAYDRLALRLRQMVRQEHVNTLSGVERFSVVQVSPLMIAHTDGDLILEDGDPDFTVSAAVRALITSSGVLVGQQAWVLREGSEWHLVDLTEVS